MKMTSDLLSCWGLQVLAMDWLRAAAAGGKVKAGCMDATVRAAVLGVADKAAEVREAGVGLAKQLLEVSVPTPRILVGNASTGSAHWSAVAQ